jgi:hypothetical protein
MNQVSYEGTFFVHSFFLGAFAKLRKATLSVMMSVRPSFQPSAHMQQLASY